MQVCGGAAVSVFELANHVGSCRANGECRCFPNPRALCVLEAQARCGVQGEAEKPPLGSVWMCP